MSRAPAERRWSSRLPKGKRWTANRFRDRVWLRARRGGGEERSERRDGGASVFEGFTFHMLRHTAASLMALAGMDPAAAAERLEHSDGGALFHKTYRHLYEGEKREKAKRLEALVRAELDEEGTADGEEPRKGSAKPIQRMGGTGLEPVTPSLSSWCSPN